MKSLCVIPARFDSTRFPGKVLAKISGKPLIQYVIEQVLKSSCLDKIIVATDDDRIKQAVSGLSDKVEVEETRSDHPSGTDRAAEVVERHSAEIIINVQADEPLMDPTLIDLLVELLRKDSSLEMATVKVPIKDSSSLQDPNCVKVVTDNVGNALYFSRSVIPYDRSQKQEPLSFKHLGIYAYRRDFLLKFISWPIGNLERIEQLEQLRALERGVRIRVVESQHDSIGVDTPEDLDRVKEYIGKKYV